MSKSNGNFWLMLAGIGLFAYAAKKIMDAQKRKTDNDFANAKEMLGHDNLYELVSLPNGTQEKHLRHDIIQSALNTVKAHRSH
ncbi:hypothetical protein [Terasakiella sp. SH-1]|uniref:hypothetical protein n=1 Tax=Terasakiella sp. SH-1 TaxID=2560057 RepID=UPI0010749C1B|nr:hypothetical protein [Terasakiella sp. SH-1]